MNYLTDFYIDKFYKKPSNDDVLYGRDFNEEICDSGSGRKRPAYGGRDSLERERQEYAAAYQAWHSKQGLKTI